MTVELLLQHLVRSKGWVYVKGLQYFGLNKLSSSNHDLKSLSQHLTNSSMWNMKARNELRSTPMIRNCTINLFFSENLIKTEHCDNASMQKIWQLKYFGSQLIMKKSWISEDIIVFVYKNQKKNWTSWEEDLKQKKKKSDTNRVKELIDSDSNLKWTGA